MCECGLEMCQRSVDAAWYVVMEAVELDCRTGNAAGRVSKIDSERRLLHMSAVAAYGVMSRRYGGV